MKWGACRGARAEASGDSHDRLSAICSPPAPSSPTAARGCMRPWPRRSRPATQPSSTSGPQCWRTACSRRYPSVPSRWRGSRSDDGCAQTPDQVGSSSDRNPKRRAVRRGGAMSSRMASKTALNCTSYRFSCQGGSNRAPKASRHRLGYGHGRSVQAHHRFSEGVGVRGLAGRRRAPRPTRCALRRSGVETPERKDMAGSVNDGALVHERDATWGGRRIRHPRSSTTSPT